VILCMKGAVRERAQVPVLGAQTRLEGFGNVDVVY
jgi:hypothetical protein